MKYKVSYEFRATVTVEVEATSEYDAEKMGRLEAEEQAHLILVYYNATVRPVT